ncbi:hypothetical protein fugu_017352 [Takifugu bimaculatus]|uniref:Uncharacterized protein n=1 Tax=Takifugu bimaculatus TaxID=433685 RepID=A0A4Z2BQS3_9TELE|nr:hypothetical protein fugu_017352 [Takifugu bimaculatus]
MSTKVAEGRLEVRQIYRLLQLVNDGNKPEVERILLLGVENLIHLTEPKDWIGVLHAATLTNNLEMVSFLLSKGAQINVQDKMGRTPAMMATELGNEAMLNLLIENNADLTLRDKEGQGVLFYCVYPTENHARCLQMVLAARAEVNSVSWRGIHVFQQMCEKMEDSISMCLHMLENGVDPNARNLETGVTALMEAAKRGFLELVQAILIKGGDPNMVDLNQLTAVHYAAMGSFLEVIMVLSGYCARMCTIDKDECTPLHYAAATGDVKCCKFLAQRGCNPLIKDKDGVLPRQIALDASYKDVAKEMKKAEKQHGKRSSSGLMTVVWALTLHDWSQVHEKELWKAFGKDSATTPTERFISVLEELKAPIEVDQLLQVVSNIEEKTECHINITEFIKGTKYINKQFLYSTFLQQKKKKQPKGPKAKKKGKFVIPFPICILPPENMPRRSGGGPPLYMIEKYNPIDSSHFNLYNPPLHPLLDDTRWYIDQPDKEFIAINNCVRNEDVQSLDLALKQGIPVDIHDPMYKTPLMVACIEGRYDVVRYLISKGVDVSKPDQFIWTPLHHAACAGHVEIVELLLEAGAAVDALRPQRGHTPHEGHSELSTLLCGCPPQIGGRCQRCQTCMDIAKSYADARVIELIQEKMEMSPPSSGKMDEAKKDKPAKTKGKSKSGAMQREKLAAGRTSLKKDSKGAIVQNARIPLVKPSAVEIAFVPKTAWEKPSITMMINREM